VHQYADFPAPSAEGISVRLQAKAMMMRGLLRKDHDASDEGPIARGSASGQPTNALPMVYDLSSDPHEDSNLWWTDLTNAWMLVPFFKRIIEYERSAKQYPNIKVGRGLHGLKEMSYVGVQIRTKRMYGGESVSQCNRLPASIGRAAWWVPLVSVFVLSACSAVARRDAVPAALEREARVADMPANIRARVGSPKDEAALAGEFVQSWKRERAYLASQGHR